MTEAPAHLGWERLWREQSRDLDLKQPRPEVLELLPRLRAEGKSGVLDLGCGLGRHLLTLAAEGFQAYGSDISPVAVATCRRRLEETGLPGEVIHADMGALPFGRETFDAVIAWNVVYHATLEDLLKTVEGVRESLRDGGYLLATFISVNDSSYAGALEGLASGEVERLEPDTFVRAGDVQTDKALPHHYTTEQELRERILRGFRILSLREDRRDWPEFEQEPRFSAHWVVLARKR